MKIKPPATKRSFTVYGKYEKTMLSIKKTEETTPEGLCPGI
jgi:hypothetical protein